jgi:hypothetical protein
VASKTIPVSMYELHLHHAPGSFVQVVASDGIINSVYGQLPLMKSYFEVWLLTAVSLDLLRPVPVVSLYLGVRTPLRGYTDGSAVCG